MALELARGDDVAAGVLAATSEGARVLSPLGDSGPVVVESSEGRSSVGTGCRRALDALKTAEASRGSLIVVLSLPLTGEDRRDLERASSDAASRGFRVLRAPIEAGARVAAAEIAEECFSFLAAKGTPPGITPQGGRVVALGLAPLSAKAWNDPPRARLALPAGTDLLLYRPAWTLELEKDAPPPLSFVGDPVPIALAVTGPSSLGLLVDAKARSFGRTIILARSATRAGLRFEGETDAPREEGPCEVAFDLAFSAGEARFEHERVFRYLAKRREGTPPPTVRVAPAKLDVGPVWSDSRTEVRLRVTGDPTRPVKVLVESPFAAAAELALAAGEERDLAVTVDARGLRGGERLKLRAEVTLAATAPVRPLAKGERPQPATVPSAAPPRLLSVPVTCEVRTLRAPAVFELGKVRAGETTARTFDLQGARVEARVVADEELGVTATLEGDKLSLRASPKEGASPGQRGGRIELALPGSKSPPVVRSFTLELDEVPRELALSVAPATLQLKGRYGWAEARVKVSATVAARFDAQPTALASSAARIGPRRDIRLKPADASWDAHALAPGEERELVLRVYLGSDLPPGKYEGTLALEARDARKTVSQPLPVTVEVER